MNNKAKQATGQCSLKGYLFMQEMLAVGATQISEMTDTPIEVAEQIAHHMVENLRKHWGGSQLYIPKTSHHELHLRDLDIYKDFTGHNHHELSRKYDLSEVTIYQILKRVRESQPKKQGDLFINHPKT